MTIHRVVVATHNPAKLDRFRSLLRRLGYDASGLKELGVVEKVKEKGATAEENAVLKAQFYAQRMQQLVLSEDEALYIDGVAEAEQPGVYVRRINGREVTDDELLAHWEGVVGRLAEEKRVGKWHIAYCLAQPGRSTVALALDHPIRFFSPPSRVRIPGWPLSSLQGPRRFGKPDCELTAEERRIKDREADDHIAAVLRKLLADI